MKNKIWFEAVVFIMLVSFVAANGLTADPDSFTVNKTVGEQPTISFILRNVYELEMKNINFEEEINGELNPLKMDPISSLSNGADINVTATVIGDKPFIGEVRIKGFYNNTIESSSEQTTIEINVVGDLSECYLQVYPGETVKWHNQHSSLPYYIINANNGKPLFAGGIPATETSEAYPFSVGNSLTYFVSASPGLGGKMSNTPCTITVLGTGLVNNPNYDAIINLNLNIEFIPTNIAVSIPVDDYTLNVGSSQQGFFTITNLGSNIAKDIILSADWFSFKDDAGNVLNNFDLSEGQSKNILYTIKPIITNTSQTDKSYVKTFTISGNFDQFTKDFNIFIPFSVVISGDETEPGLEELVKQYMEVIIAYCNDNPNSLECKSLLSNVIVGYNATTDDDSNIAILKILAEFMNQQNLNDNIQKELTTDIINSTGENLQRTESLEGRVGSLEELINNINASAVLLTMTYGTIVVIAILLVLIYLKRQKNKHKSLTYY